MTQPLSIQGELTVFTAHALKSQLLDAIAENAHLQLDLDEVTDVDGTGLQLLLAAQREAVHRQGSLLLLRPSPQVCAVLKLTHLADEFDVGATQ